MHSIRLGVWASAIVALSSAFSGARPDSTNISLAHESGVETNKIQGGRAMKEHRSGEWSPGLTEDEKVSLFAIAKDTLPWCVSSPQRPFSFDRYTLTPRLKEETASFVTLKKRGMLRGCIGTLAPMDPLYLSIHKNAVSASLEDCRFRPVSAEELPQLEIHLSILSPIRSVASIAEFTIGAHGIIMEKGASRAVYLPEVAVEQKWTKEETLSSLSEKAGLPADAWKQGARFKVFSSVALSEE